MANIIKNRILREKLKIILKNHKQPREITSRFLRGRKRRKAAGHESVFCQNLGITTYTLKVLKV